ncbi:hypothetical protein J6R97_00010 [bacterium]|nr:hypothetical protein [bacterium]
MNITNSMQTNFQGYSEFILRVPGKNDTTLVNTIKIRFPDKGPYNEKIVGISSNIMRKGKVLDSYSFQNKSGFKPERFARICGKIQTHVKDGFNFMEELFVACARRF